LFASITTPDYPGETYTAPPVGDTTRVFFTGQPITFGITIANRTASNQSLKVAPDARGYIFDIRVKEDRSGTGALTSRAVISAGARLTVDLSTDLVPLNSQISLAPGERLQWTVDIQGRLAPGQYSITASFRGTDGADRELVWQVHTIEFEVRAGNTAPAEVEYREAVRHLRDDDAIERRAEAAITRLLRRHPQSYAAYSLLAALEEQRGRTAEAMRHYERATDLLEKHADMLLLKFKTPEQVERIKAALKARRDK
jgi:tetratricopeptide (TPR) repeat protein